MGRTKMSDEEKLLRLLGHDPEEVKEFIADSTQAADEAEATLAYLAAPKDWTLPKKCLEVECGQYFVANRPSVGYCSDKCRAHALEAIGLKWNPDKTPEERWGHYSGVPLVLPQRVLLVLKAALVELPENDVLLPSTLPISQTHYTESQNLSTVV